MIFFTYVDKNNDPVYCGYCQKTAVIQGSMYGFYDIGGQSYHYFQMEEKKMTDEWMKDTNVDAMCITVIVISTIKLTTWPGGAQRHTKRFPTMPVQLEGKTINKSQGVSRRMGVCKSIPISQTKVSFSQSATGKLILMTMIGTLISIAPVRCFLSPYFNISPFPSFWCLTVWKAKQYFC